MIIIISEKKLKQLIKEVLMTDTNLADAVKSISAKLDTVIANQATPVPVDLKPVLDAVQALSDKIDSIDTPTS